MGTIELSAGVDITINGIDAGDSSSWGLGTGDVNNDRVTDLVIGAPKADPDGKTDAGEIYVLFGPLGKGVLELATESDITFKGTETNQILGNEVAIGDLNHDGISDIAFASALADPGGRDNAGETLVVFGPVATGTVEITSVVGAVFEGIDPGDQSGGGLAVGDVNGDGKDDLVIGGMRADPNSKLDAGEIYVIHGPLSAGTRELSAGVDVTFNGINASDGAGTGLDIDDVNNDGAEDIIIGAFIASPGGRREAGVVYVIFGTPPSVHLEVKQTGAPNPIAAGTELTYLITVTNNGASMSV